VLKSQRIKKSTIPFSGKFKVLHGFNGVLAVFFSFWAHFYAALAAQKPRFSGLRCRSGHTAPTGRRVCFAPLQSLARPKSVCLINVGRFFIFGIGIAVKKSGRTRINYPELEAKED
jgi:hypothetical protein